MKHLLILITFVTVIVITAGCGSEDESGYNCSGGNCQATFDSPQYLTIADCQNNCSGGGGTVQNGSVKVIASWSNPSPWNMCGSPYTVTIGIGYSSNDVANQAYFAQGNFYSSSATFQRTNLVPGVYYYGARKVFNASTCGTGQGIPPTVFKTGAFTVTSGQTTNVSTSLN